MLLPVIHVGIIQLGLQGKEFLGDKSPHWGLEAKVLPQSGAAGDT